MQVVNYCDYWWAHWNLKYNVAQINDAQKYDQKCVWQWAHKTHIKGKYFAAVTSQSHRQDNAAKNVIPQSASWECAHKTAIKVHQQVSHSKLAKKSGYYTSIIQWNNDAVIQWQ